jgi:hypothetical protein
MRKWKTYQWNSQKYDVSVRTASEAVRMWKSRGFLLIGWGKWVKLYVVWANVNFSKRIMQIGVILWCYKIANIPKSEFRHASLATFVLSVLVCYSLMKCISFLYADVESNVFFLRVPSPDERQEWRQPGDMMLATINVIRNSNKLYLLVMSYVVITHNNKVLAILLRVAD